MKQELGETVQAMMEDDLKSIQNVLNTHKTGRYWILVHHKLAKERLSTGHQIMKRIIRVFDKKPPKLIGTVVYEVSEGNVVDHWVNLPDVPINWGLIESMAGLSAEPLVQENTLASEYFYNQ